MPAGAEKQFVINFLEGMKEVSDDTARSLGVKGPYLFSVDKIVERYRF